MSKRFQMIKLPDYTLPAAERKRRLGDEAFRFFQLADAVVKDLAVVRGQRAAALEAGDQRAAGRLQRRLRHLAELHSDYIGIHLALLVMHAHLEDDGSPPAAQPGAKE
jgi:hypothetical protein